MSAAAFFDAARALKREATGNAGAGLTDTEVAALNAVVGAWKPATALLNPTALTDAAEFFKAVRGAFGALTEPQVQGFQTLLQAFGVARWPLAWAAYGLGTAWHETAAQMQPVREAYWLSEDWRKANLTKYYPAYGRGFVQITWAANYAKADAALDLNGALIDNYDLALDPNIAARIIVWGMEHGEFSGKKLGDYLPMSNRAGFDAYKAARYIVNGQDKADVIAKEAQQFEAALIAGGWK